MESKPPVHDRIARADARTWHRKASKPVTIWMVLLVAVSLIHWAIPDYRWVLIHMFTLGVLTNSVMLWSQHFTEKFLHHRLADDTRKLQLIRFYILNAGIVMTIIGQLLAPVMHKHWIITAIGAAIVGGSLAFHAYYLGKQYLHHGHNQRYRPAVLAYILSAEWLPCGAIVGALLATDPADELKSRLIIAHFAFNILGFIGLAAIGSLLLLFPTIWRTNVVVKFPLWVITALVAGIIIIAGGALAGLPTVVAIGVGSYMLGLGFCIISWVRCVLAVLKDPRDRVGFAAASIAAAPLWLVGSLGWIAFQLFTTQSLTQVHVPVMALLVGFGGQLLIGVMSYLLPSNIGGGPDAVRTGLATYNRAGLFRFTLVNLGLAAWLITEDSWLRVITSIGAMGSLAVFIVLTPFAVRAQLGVIRKQREPLSLPPKPQTGQITFACALLALVIASFGGLFPANQAPVITTSQGPQTVVEIRMQDTKFVPDMIEVPAGHSLIVELHNDDHHAHDLKLANGLRTGRIEPGEHTQLNVGVVNSALQGWCTIAGHRAQGMELTIVPTNSQGTASELHQHDMHQHEMPQQHQEGHHHNDPASPGPAQPATPHAQLPQVQQDFRPAENGVDYSKPAVKRR
ncbi:cupredoxin domain-containing protein [Corynebacterium sp. HS2168-gen11]|uniref:cupredoxin domain-containing protein n=1 Tax=Corynebacterium sp. HS2168-gen11 TaxID=2974027 RepID=UPI00216B2207|nr:cupredoxin domain-containing protein [Corynebacterium sp. HS2168-gen11]MCS4536493.1 cupredoxin domain-containing protein [Corynebacterium sp. HS2168-gen11]